MAAKAHAILSASSSDRWLHCPPSARLCETYEDKGSDYAAEGTDAHALGEYKLIPHSVCLPTIQPKALSGIVMPNENTNVKSGYFTHERIQGDLNYIRAQGITKKMLDDGLISVAEFNKLTAINRETFSPLFTEIIPEMP